MSGGGGITWRVEHALTEGEALVLGEHTLHGGCLYVVSTDGSYEISDDTDGDFGGEGWPSPPRACLAEARALARGTAGTAHAEVTS